MGCPEHTWVLSELERTGFTMKLPLPSLPVSSLQIEDGINALGEIHVRPTPFLGSFSNVAFIQFQCMLD